MKDPHVLLLWPYISFQNAKILLIHKVAVVIWVQSDARDKFALHCCKLVCQNALMF